MTHLLLISLACAGVSFTITSTSIFHWVRESISSIHPKLEELIHCPWCLNHYVVLVTICFTGYIPISDYYAVDVLITWFSIVAIGGPIHYVLLRAYRPVMKLMIERKIEKLTNHKQKV